MPLLRTIILIVIIIFDVTQIFHLLRGFHRIQRDFSRYNRSYSNWLSDEGIETKTSRNATYKAANRLIAREIIPKFNRFLSAAYRKVFDSSESEGKRSTKAGVN